MTNSEQALVSFLTANYPDTLYIARQYGSMYGMTLPNAVRYAVGLTGDVLSPESRAQILTMVEAAENQSTGAGGFSLSPVMLGILALAAYMALS